MAQVWYPAKDEPFSAPRVPYMGDAGAVTTAMARIVHFPSFFLTHFKYVTTNAVSRAPVADAEPSYPVLLFLSGLGGFRASNTYQVEELVSHGYVVVGLDQPGGSAAVHLPDGRVVSVLPREQIQALIQQSTSPKRDAPALHGQALENGIIPYFAQDASFAIDQLISLNKSDPNDLLAGRLDVQRVGVFGVSLGAIVGVLRQVPEGPTGAAARRAGGAIPRSGPGKAVARLKAGTAPHPAAPAFLDRWYRID
jgi:hypothetical protein